MASAAPAYAASVCSTTSKAAIDAALAFSAKSTLEVNFYQTLQSGNGYLGESWVNLKNTGASDLTFTSSNPLVLRLEITGLTGTGERAYASPSTSWGTLTDLGYNAATKTRTYEWRFVGTIPHTGDNEADVWFHWQDGGLLDRRVTNVVKVTPLSSSAPTAPTLNSILSADDQRTACGSYYKDKLATYTQTAQKTAFTYRGPKGAGTLAIGQTVSSGTIGDYYAGANAGDGIY